MLETEYAEMKVAMPYTDELLLPELRRMGRHSNHRRHDMQQSPAMKSTAGEIKHGLTKKSEFSRKNYWVVRLAPQAVIAT